MIAVERIRDLLDQFPKLQIALVGDLFLDRYLELAAGVHELSIETGLEAYQVHRVRNSPGALGTVMNNLAALRVGRLMPVTVLGDDGHAYDLLATLAPLPVDPARILRDPKRLTPTYTKPLQKRLAEGGWQELNRLDIRSREPLSETMTATLLNHVREAFHQCDGLIVLDQIAEPNWGVVNQAVRGLLEQLARENPDKLIFVDSREHLGQFRSGVLKGNHHEVQRAARAAGEDGESLERALATLSRKTGRSVYCTIGERGILVAETPQRITPVAGFAVPGPVDIVGAGDSATSGIVASLLAGATPVEAATVGNLAASITVQQIGTTGTASPEQLLARAAERA